MNALQLAEKYKMLSPEEVALIKYCVSLLPPQPVIVNIGANVGTSTCAILEANPEAFIFSIDKHPCPEERESLIACNLPANRVVRVLGRSNRVGQFWPYQVDMVFVDGAHHDEAVMSDIEIWKPRCRQIMAFHDYKHPNIPSMPAIVDEAMKDWRRIGEARYLIAFEK